MGMDERRAVCDAAYAIQFTDEYKRWRTLPKKHKVTLIPYFRSGPLVHYSTIKAFKNWSILRSDQYGSIDTALTRIASSQFILTESLHGAILADALRVPWMRVWYYLERPSDIETGEFKWRDWQESLNIPHIPTLRIPLSPQRWVSGKKSLLLKPWRTVQYLQHLKIEESFVLSPEPNWIQATDRLKEELKILQE
jgi:succinoglycan biosynthesis protein ExoV